MYIYNYTEYENVKIQTMRSIKIIKSDIEDFDVSLFKTEIGSHHGKEVIWIDFPKDQRLINMLKLHFTAQWSAGNKRWFVRDTRENRKGFFLPAKIVGKDVYDKISEINQTEFLKYQNQLVLKGFSENTIRTYTLEFAQLLYEIKNFPVENLTSERLQSYFLYCHKEKELSENQIHSRMNAIKFYFEKVLYQSKMFFDIPRPKKPLLLPKYLNIEEVKRLFDSTDNIKHLVMLKLCYGLGLRVSEIIALKVSDIDSVSMKVLIERGKGKKDRYVNLPESILEDLRNYYRVFQPKNYLFEGKIGDQYSIRSAQIVFKNAMTKAGIRKKIGIHGLRHSYATHLLELGTDISLIQKLLGHENINTTLTYTQVTDPVINKVISPLDRI